MTELLWVVVGIVIGGGLVAGRRWTSLDAARFEAEVNWNRYVEAERKRNTVRKDLEAAQIRIKTLEGERNRRLSAHPTGRRGAGRHPAGAGRARIHPRGNRIRAAVLELSKPTN